MCTFADKSGKVMLTYGNDWSSTMCQCSTLNLLYAIASCEKTNNILRSPFHNGKSVFLYSQLGYRISYKMV